MAVATRPEIRELSPNIGAEIRGVDLSKPIDPPMVAAIIDIWHAHGIILFRGQNINEDDQARFSAYIGPGAGVMHRHDGGSKRHSGIMYISNIRENGKLIGALPDGEMMFHSDQCYVERPTMASMLFAMEIPSKGGNTLFANMYMAYDTLPETLKTRLAGMTALNVYDYDNAGTMRGPVRPEAPQYAHPIFRTHPATGKKALYVNRLMSQSIIGMDPIESEKTLAFLFDHMENPAWIYEHVWKVGDFLMWDNRCTAHARTDFDASERRLLRRAVVLGEKPY